MTHSSGLLRSVINAWGTPTPYGVSRSDAAVAHAAADMLQRHVVMSELQARAGQALAAWSGAPRRLASAHCSASAITLAVAACMTGQDGARIAQLPDVQGLPHRVLMLASHQVNYGHAITQAIRLAGALPVPCAWSVNWTPPTADPSPACSRWSRRAGRAALVAAVDAQHGGIGRAMKPTKEALAGVLAALQARTLSARGDWLAAQQRKVAALAESLAGWPGVQTYRESDPLCGGFERLWLAIDPDITGVDAAAMVQRLRDADPVIAVAPHRVAQGQIGLELSGVGTTVKWPTCAQVFSERWSTVRGLDASAPHFEPDFIDGLATRIDQRQPVPPWPGQPLHHGPASQRLAVEQPARTRSVGRELHALAGRGNVGVKRQDGAIGRCGDPGWPAKGLFSHFQAFLIFPQREWVIVSY